RLLSASDVLQRIAVSATRGGDAAGAAPLDVDVLSLADTIARLDAAAPLPIVSAPKAGEAAEPAPVGVERQAAFVADAEEDRILRVRASHLSRLVALSGESL